MSNHNMYDLFVNYVSALNSENKQKRERYKSLITTAMISLGYKPLKIDQAINALSITTKKSDVMKILARYNLIDEDASTTLKVKKVLPKDEKKKYLIMFKFLFITRENYKSEIIKLKSFLRDNNIDLLKFKYYTTNAKDDRSIVIDLKAKVLIKTDFDRNALLDLFEPDYYVLQIKNLSKGEDK